MKNAIWRSRAIAILGFLIVMLAIFPSLPSTLKTTLFVAGGFVITSLGIVGSQRSAYQVQSSSKKSPDVQTTATDLEPSVSSPEETQS